MDAQVRPHYIGSLPNSSSAPADEIITTLMSIPEPRITMRGKTVCPRCGKRHSEEWDVNGERITSNYEDHYQHYHDVLARSGVREVLS